MILSREGQFKALLCQLDVLWNIEKTWHASVTLLPPIYPANYHIDLQGLSAASLEAFAAQKYWDLNLYNVISVIVRRWFKYNSHVIPFSVFSKSVFLSLFFNHSISSFVMHIGERSWARVDLQWQPKKKKGNNCIWSSSELWIWSLNCIWSSSFFSFSFSGKNGKRLNVLRVELGFWVFRQWALIRDMLIVGPTVDGIWSFKLFSSEPCSWWT